MTSHSSTALLGHCAPLDHRAAAHSTRSVERETELLVNERAWLVQHVLPRALVSLREGLAECTALLRSASVTLPLSSRETECLKGVITRRGPRLVKGNLLIKLKRLHAKLALAVETTDTSDDDDEDNTSPPGVGLPQLESVVTSVLTASRALAEDIFSTDDVVQRVEDVLGMLRSAEASLEGSDDPRRLFPSPTSTPALAQRPTTPDRQSLDRLAARVGHRFPHVSLPADTFQPRLTDNIVVDLYVRECAVVCEVVLLAERGDAGASPLLARLAKNLLSTQSPPTRGDGNSDPSLGEFVRHRGRDVKVLERVKVASQDPALIACGAKLSSLVHALDQVRQKLQCTGQS